MQETYNEDGSLTLIVNNKGTYSDMYDGQTSEEFTSEGDQTTNKEVTAGNFDKDYGAPAIDELGKKRDFANENELASLRNTLMHLPKRTELFANITDYGLSYNWSASVYVAGNTQLLNDVRFYGINRQSSLNTYLNTSWDGGTNQLKVWNKIKDQLTLRSDKYVMYDNHLLIAAPVSDPDWVGCYGTVIDLYGHYVDVIYVDTKGFKGNDVSVSNSKETFDAGVYLGMHQGKGAIDVMEIFCESVPEGETGYTAFRYFDDEFDTRFEDGISGWTKGQSILNEG